MWMAYHLVYRQFLGENPVPQGSRHPSFAPYCDFATADGKLLIGISNDRLFRRLCGALERPEWGADPLYSTNVQRVRNHRQLEALLQGILLENTTAHWMEVFDANDVPAGPIQTVDQVLEDPQLAALGQMENLTLTSGAVAVPRLPVELSLTEAGVSSPPPNLGEHGLAILTEAGYTEAEIAELVQNGVCKLQ